MPELQLEENIDNYIDSVRAFLIDTINETHVKYFKDKDDPKGYKLTPEMRLNNCIDYKLIPFIDSINGDGNTIIIYSSVSRACYQIVQDTALPVAIFLDYRSLLIY